MFLIRSHKNVYVPNKPFSPPRTNYVNRVIIHALTVWDLVILNVQNAAKKITGKLQQMKPPIHVSV